MLPRWLKLLQTLPNSSNQQTTYRDMNSLRIARVAARIGPTASRLRLQRRGYADTVSDKIQLTLALPHQVR